MAKEVAVIDKKLLSEIEKKFRDDASQDEAFRGVAVSSELIPASAKVNITDKILTELEKRAVGLKINGLEDKEGFKNVQNLRKLAKKIRTSGVAVTKAGRAKSVEIQKAWLKVEQDFETRVLKTEDALEEQEKEYLKLEAADKERIANEQAIVYTTRVTSLSNLNVLFDQSANTFTLGDVVYDGALVREADEEIFSTMLAEFEEEHDKLHQEEIKEQEEAKTRQENDLRFVRKTLLDALNAPVDEKVDLGTMKQEDWDAIYTDLKKKFDDEKLRIENESKAEAKKKLDARIEVLTEMGLIRTIGNVVYFKDNKEKLTVSEDSIAALDDVDFKKTYSYLSDRIVEIDREYEKEVEEERKKHDKEIKLQAVTDTRRGLLKAIGTTYEKDDLGTMSEEEWNSRYSMAKTRYDLKQEELRNEELKTKTDSQQWKHFIEDIAKLRIPEAKGKTFKAKIDTATNLLNQIKTL